MDWPTENPIDVIKLIGVNAWAVYTVLVFFQKPMSNRELQIHLPLSEKTITGLIRILLEHRLITAVTRMGPWTAAIHGRQMLLTFDKEGGVRKFYGLPATTTTAFKKNSRESHKISGAAAAVESFNAPESVNSTDSVNSEMINSNFRSCQQAGIGEPKAGEISRREHVTPDFIQAHVRDLKEGESLGLAVIRILSGELPRSWRDEIKDIPRPKTRRRKK